MVINSLHKWPVKLSAKAVRNTTAYFARHYHELNQLPYQYGRLHVFNAYRHLCVLKRINQLDMFNLWAMYALDVRLMSASVRQLVEIATTFGKEYKYLGVTKMHKLYSMTPYELLFESKVDPDASIIPLDAAPESASVYVVILSNKRLSDCGGTIRTT